MTATLSPCGVSLAKSTVQSTSDRDAVEKGGRHTMWCRSFHMEDPGRDPGQEYAKSVYQPNPNRKFRMVAELFKQNQKI